eukprot:11871509-Karenia_brevis.AAC.1
MNQQEIGSLVHGGPDSECSIFVQHIHDEAAMRMRSFANQDGPDLLHRDLQLPGRMKLARSRYSK